MNQFWITVDKAELLERITTNRDNHRAIFEKAVGGYQAMLLDELEERIERVKAGKAVDKYIRLVEPEDHTEDYDRVIDMLNMHVGTAIDIPQEDFAMYVRDDWAWKRQWVETTSSYL